MLDQASAVHELVGRISSVLGMPAPSPIGPHAEERGSYGVPMLDEIANDRDRVQRIRAVVIDALERLAL